MNRHRFVFLATVFALSVLVAPGAQAASVVTIISGNGQVNVPPALAPQYIPIFQPLVVQVTNENGVPQAGVGVNWTLGGTFSGAVLSPGSPTFTDASGFASVNLFFQLSPQGFAGSYFSQFTVTANTSDSNSAIFTETLGLPSPSVGGTTGAGLQPITTLAGPFLGGILAGEVLSGQAGSTGTQPFVVHVQTVSGFPIPNISLQLVPVQNPSLGPVVTCAESQGGKNMVLTDQVGNASCTPLLAGAPGTGQFYVLIGAGGATPVDPLVPPSLALWYGYQPNNAGSGSAFLKLNVTAATATSIKITQGGTQTVNPSQTVPVPLQVQVDGASGPLAGQQVQWSASPANMVSITNPTTSTDSAGKTSITVQVLGNATGNITITAKVASNASLTSTFTITVVPVVTITGFTMVSGNNQTATVGSSFSQPLVVQVAVSAGSAANVPVQFLSSGPVSLSSTNVSTDSNGRAQVTVTAGSVSGSASITASIATNSGVGSQTFNLTVLPPAPLISASNFVNGADYQLNSLSPCSIGAVVANAGALGVANVSPTFPGQPLNNSQAQLTINNVGAPILSIGNLPSGQQAITFQVPCEVSPGGSVPAVLTLAGSSINITLNIQAASPGIFQTVGTDGVLRAVVIRPDGSSVTLTNPARRGENASIFVTGLGTTSPIVGTSSVPSLGTPTNAQATIVVGMAGSGVTVIAARLTEELPGVFRVTFTIPADMQTGSNVTISVAAIPQGSSTPIYSAGSKITVQ